MALDLAEEIAPVAAEQQPETSAPAPAPTNASRSTVSNINRKLTDLLERLKQQFSRPKQVVPSLSRAAGSVPLAIPRPPVTPMKTDWLSQAKNILGKFKKTPTKIPVEGGQVQKQDISLVLAVAILFLAAAGYQYILPLNEHRAQAEQNLIDLTAIESDLNKQIEVLKQAKLSEPEIKSKKERLYKAVPLDHDEAGVVSQLEDMVNRFGLVFKTPPKVSEIKKSDKLPATFSDQYKIYQYIFSVSGSEAQVFSFLQALEDSGLKNNERLFVLPSVSVQQDVKDPTKVELVAPLITLSANF